MIQVGNLYLFVTQSVVVKYLEQCCPKEIKYKLQIQDTNVIFTFVIITLKIVKTNGNY